jgi:hypothetical protein
MLRMASLALMFLCASAYAQDGGSVGFLNLTASEIMSLKLSPAGKQEWGENRGKESGVGVGYNKRLTVMDVEAGLYDVKFRDKLHRECVLKNIDIRDNAVISIEERKLVGHCRLL